MIKISTILSLSLMMAMLVASYAYYLIFGNSLNTEAGIFINAINLHDHLIYVDNITFVSDGESIIEIANDKGIATIYLWLGKLIMPWSGLSEWQDISYLINIITLLVFYLIYIKLCDRMQVGIEGKLVFFANIHLLYLTQLINKDILTEALIILFVYLMKVNKLKRIIVVIPFISLVRIQILLLALVLIFINKENKRIKRIFIVYVVTSIVAGWLTTLFPLSDSLENGLSRFIFEFNHNYIVGYLIFNPLRSMQYIQSLLNFDIINEYYRIDLVELLRVPQVIAVLAYSRYIVQMYNKRLWTDNIDIKLLLTTIAAYMTVWLMNPTINARYVMLIVPVVILLGIKSKKILKESERRNNILVKNNQSNIVGVYKI